MNRNCQKCIHHISGLCSKWECEMQTLEDYRNKVIDEFLKKICEKYTEEERKGNYKQFCANSSMALFLILSTQVLLVQVYPYPSNSSVSE